jgi:hypothetical protein
VGKPFPLLAHRRYAGALVSMAPSMDVACLVSNEGDLVFFRTMDGQRLSSAPTRDWISHSTPVHVLDLAFSPHGSFALCFDQTGRTHLVPAEGATTSRGSQKAIPPGMRPQDTDLRPWQAPFILQPPPKGWHGAAVRWAALSLALPPEEGLLDGDPSETFSPNAWVFSSKDALLQFVETSLTAISGGRTLTDTSDPSWTGRLPEVVHERLSALNCDIPRVVTVSKAVDEALRAEGSFATHPNAMVPSGAASASSALIVQAWNEEGHSTTVLALGGWLPVCRIHHRVRVGVPALAPTLDSVFALELGPVPRVARYDLRHLQPDFGALTYLVRSFARIRQGVEDARRCVHCIDRVWEDLMRDTQFLWEGLARALKQAIDAFYATWSCREAGKSTDTVSGCLHRFLVFGADGSDIVSTVVAATSVKTSLSGASLAVVDSFKAAKTVEQEESTVSLSSTSITGGISSGEIDPESVQPPFLPVQVRSPPEREVLGVGSAVRQWLDQAEGGGKILALRRKVSVTASALEVSFVQGCDRALESALGHLEDLVAWLECFHVRHGRGVAQPPSSDAPQTEACKLLLDAVHHAYQSLRETRLSLREACFSLDGLLRMLQRGREVATLEDEESTHPRQPTLAAAEQLAVTFRERLRSTPVFTTTEADAILSHLARVAALEPPAVDSVTREHHDPLGLRASSAAAAAAAAKKKRERDPFLAADLSALLHGPGGAAVLTSCEHSLNEALREFSPRSPHPVHLPLTSSPVDVGACDIRCTAQGEAVILTVIGRTIRCVITSSPSGSLEVAVSREWELEDGQEALCATLLVQTEHISALLAIREGEALRLVRIPFSAARDTSGPLASVPGVQTQAVEEVPSVGEGPVHLSVSAERGVAVLLAGDSQVMVFELTDSEWSDDDASE